MARPPPDPDVLAILTRLYQEGVFDAFITRFLARPINQDALRQTRSSQPFSSFSTSFFPKVSSRTTASRPSTSVTSQSPRTSASTPTNTAPSTNGGRWKTKKTKTKKHQPNLSRTKCSPNRRNGMKNNPEQQKHQHRAFKRSAGPGRMASARGGFQGHGGDERGHRIGFDKGSGASPFQPQGSQTLGGLKPGRVQQKRQADVGPRQGFQRTASITEPILDSVGLGTGRLQHKHPSEGSSARLDYLRCCFCSELHGTVRMGRHDFQIPQNSSRMVKTKHSATDCANLSYLICCPKAGENKTNCGCVASK